MSTARRVFFGSGAIDALLDTRRGAIPHRSPRCLEFPPPSRIAKQSLSAAEGLAGRDGIGDHQKSP